ncbi:hypothetical protein [Chitinophaga cymbidii]|uniref:Peptidase M43 pregnancy-associated plasma-A domain-containing protein n=1 Tax=Chitinophaga cymbidii TaxID=1096750 RepID=A0A512RRY7_9BACT|nr:hypothetical protein [Chitinophaga cymbidii]GEP98446.1 hypothetical protein CCY01nite_47060 [Chitinophaga cymbidii]
MNKIITGLALLVIFIHAGCRKDSFDYKMYQPTIDDIDSIYLSTTDKMMVADGQATLNFIVEAYRTVHLSSGKDSLEFVDYRLLPEGSLKIVEERSGTEVGMSYSTTTVPFDTVKFHAQIGSVKSDTKPVALRPKPVLPSKLYVDVIFHVWELNNTHPTYDVSSYQPVQQAQLEEAIRYMNDVVNNKVGYSPNGASANIEFRLAVNNPAGLELSQPGMNRIIYSDNVKTNPLAVSFGVNDFVNYVNANTGTLIWNPKEYLNVHVIPIGANYALGTAYPAKQLAIPGEDPILGVAGTAASEDDFVMNFANTCAGLPRTVLFPGHERKIEAFRYIGTFYGLYTPLYSASRLYSDYCYDTRKFDGQDKRNSYSFATKVGIDNEKYIADNAMDDIRYPTLLSSITVDQVARMRAVMTRCPGRMNTKDQ